MDIAEIFRKQQAFQDLIGSQVDFEVDANSRNQMYLETCLYTIEEIIEGLREIDHKKWKKTPHIDNIDNLKDELIDEFRFFINRCILVGLTPEEFADRFNASLNKTYERFNNNY